LPLCGITFDNLWGLSAAAAAHSWHRECRETRGAAPMERKGAWPSRNASYQAAPKDSVCGQIQ